MKHLNKILSINSLIVLAIIIERLTPTGKIILQPYNFISLHQFIQATIFIPAFIVVSILLLKEFTDNFRSLPGKQNTFLLMTFIVGAYLFGTGEGWHEVASFMYAQSCHMSVVTQFCGGLFTNNYYAGNGIFFIGGLLMYLSLLSFAAKQPVKDFTNIDMVILLVNSVVTALTWFAYAAFDKVLLGLAFSAILALSSIFFLWKLKYVFRKYPYITYSAVAYTLSTIATVLVRFLR